DFETLTDDDKDVLFERAYESYVKCTALVGTPDSCLPVVRKLEAIGVDEIACLIDFGVEPAMVLDSLPVLTELKNRSIRRSEFEWEAADRSAARNGAFESDCGEKRVPLTEAQKQLVLLSQMNLDGSIAYNEPVVLELRGPLRMDALAHAVQLLVDRHEALRSRISIQDSELVIASHLKTEVSLSDFSSLCDGEQAAQVSRWFADRSRAAFDLELGPLLKVGVLKLAEERHYLYFSAHHTVVDGAAIGVLLTELGALYSAEVGGASAALPPAMQVSDYERWLSQSIMKKEWQHQKDFWIGRLSGSSPTLDFPTDRPRPPRKTYRGRRLIASLDPQLYADIKRVAQRANCTLFMTLFAAYAVLLHRFADQEEIIIGTAVLGRSLPGADRLVAYCAHILPIRSDVGGRPTFTEHLTVIRSALLEAYENQDFPFANYLSDLDIPRDPSRAPLVDYCFNLDGETAAPTMAGLDVAYHDQPVFTSRFDISLNGVEIDSRLVLYCDYNTDLLKPVTIERLLDAFKVLLKSISERPDCDVLGLPLLSADERAEILTEFNAPSHPVPKCRHQTIHQYFEAQVESAPDAVAVVVPGIGISERQSVTYSELNERANQLGHYLLLRGVANEDLIAIYLDRSVEMVVALLAILKAGRSYLPLDPDYPPGRVDFILKDSRARFIVTRQAFRDNL
ncbi:MAG: AMP-binding protein, partial [Acetobacteraceae bacterium]|nr:AMP-binding protein [Acetobacteraceae bacterium]